MVTVKDTEVMRLNSEAWPYKRFARKVPGPNMTGLSEVDTNISGS
jgi:hypothetical protein